MIGRLLVSHFSSSFSAREMFLVEQVLASLGCTTALYVRSRKSCRCACQRSHGVTLAVCLTAKQQQGIGNKLENLL